MRLLPLTLSAHPSAWLGGAETHEGQEAPRTSGRRAPLRAELVTSDDPEACRFCGLRTTARHEAFHLNGDHADNNPENLVTACALCHLCQHLDDAEAAQAATLIWLPEISQTALITMVRSAHAVLAGQREARGARVRSDAAAVKSGVQRAMAAFQARADVAKRILGTSRPAILGSALLALDRTSYGERETLLDGIRLLPTGRLIRSGRDVFPDLLRQWCPPATRSERTAA